MAISETLHRRRKSTRGNSGVWEDPGRTYVDAMGWIGQQKVHMCTSLSPFISPFLFLSLFLTHAYSLTLMSKERISCEFI